MILDQNEVSLCRTWELSAKSKWSFGLSISSITLFYLRKIHLFSGCYFLVLISICLVCSNISQNVFYYDNGRKRNISVILSSHSRRKYMLLWLLAHTLFAGIYKWRVHPNTSQSHTFFAQLSCIDCLSWKKKSPHKRSGPCFCLRSISFDQSRSPSAIAMPI